jgi:hypothetical protein
MATNLRQLGRRFWPWALLVAFAVVLLVALGLTFGTRTFGNAAEWAAAFGTIAAFGATVALLRRDVAERERRQAALVSCWAEVHLRTPDNPVHYAELIARNGSDETIHDLAIWHVIDGTVVRGHTVGTVAPRSQTWARVELTPGKKAHAAVTFFDSAGLEWERDWRGRLQRRRFTEPGRPMVS